MHSGSCLCGTQLAMHIQVASKGDYYDIADDVPKYDSVPPMPTACLPNE